MLFVVSFEFEGVVVLTEGLEPLVLPEGLDPIHGRLLGKNTETFLVCITKQAQSRK